MTLPIYELPPPVIFAHDETLHAICLPPLASFLASLTATEHLIKLNDILDRFRTPKSYHRIDVRAVESSELPPHSPAEREREREREKGEPLILDPGVGIEEYRARKAGDGNAGQPRERSSNGQVEEGPLTNGDEGAAGPASDDHSHIDVAPFTPLTSTLLDQNGEGSAITHTRKDASPLHLVPPTTDLDPAPPSSTHPLPPLPKKRRIRELRLDVRTLDAAALFALETWRRQVLGLQKLDMEFPDSIWYKEPSPTPPPPPPPPAKVPQKRWRPQKKASTEARQIFENYESLMEAISGNGEIPEIALGAEEADPEMAEAMILDALDELARQDGHDAATGAPVQYTEALMEVDRSHVDIADVELSTGPITEAGPSVIPPESPSATRSPSADLVLGDAFNEKEVADPDFQLQRLTPVSDESEESTSPETKSGRPPKVSGATSSASNVERTSPKKRGRPPRVNGSLSHTKDIPTSKGSSRSGLRRRSQASELLVSQLLVPSLNRSSSVRSKRARISAELIKDEVAEPSPSSPSIRLKRQRILSVEIPIAKKAKKKVGRASISLLCEKSVRFADEEDVVGCEEEQDQERE